MRARDSSLVAVLLVLVFQAFHPGACRGAEPFLPRSLTTLCELRSFLQSDIRKTYGRAPEFGLRYHGPARGRCQGLVGAGILVKSGSPYYRNSVGSRKNAHLTVVSLEPGFRVALLAGDRFRFFAGPALDLAWSRERLPPPYEGAPSRVTQGYGLGLRVFAGPEWDLRDGRMALGLEISGLVGETVGTDPDSPDVVFSGTSARAAFSLRI